MSGNLWTAPTQQLMVGVSTAKNNFTAATDLPCSENAAAFPIIFGGTLNPGTLIDIDAWGVFSTTGTPTLLLGWYYGLVAGVSIAAGAAKTTGSGVTNVAWAYSYNGRITKIGTSGAIIGLAYWKLHSSNSAWTEYTAPEAAMAEVTIDTTVNKQISIGATWGTASASNTITCHGMMVRITG